MKTKLVSPLLYCSKTYDLALTGKKALSISALPGKKESKTVVGYTYIKKIIVLINMNAKLILS